MAGLAIAVRSIGARGTRIEHTPSPLLLRAVERQPVGGAKVEAFQAGTFARRHRFALDAHAGPRARWAASRLHLRVAQPT